jgi:heme-degrading monooxygenase HmoA
MQQVLGGALSAGGEGTPEALRAMLIFPYTSGLRFVHYALRRGGYEEVDKVFQRLPTTSKEILHPEMYFSGKPSSRDVPLSELDAFSGATGSIYSDTLGEFGISAMLCSAVKDRREGVEAAKGWFGDRLAVYKVDPEHALVAWKSVWETEQDASEFKKAYSELIKNKYGKEPSDERTELDPSKSIEVKSDGPNVLIRFWINAANL